MSERALGLAMAVAAVVYLYNKFHEEIEKSKWKWFDRNVESSIRRTLRKNCQFIHLRGARMVGKTSTIKNILKIEGKKNLYFRIKPNSDQQTDLDWINEQLHQSGFNRVSSLYLFQKLLIRLIGSENYFFVFDEIQLSSTSFQTLLQESIDTLQLSFITSEIPYCGGIIVMGSFPLISDQVIEGLDQPLHRRFEIQFSLTKFNCSEMNRVYKYLKITKPSKMLKLKTFLGDLPIFLKLCVEEEVLNDDDDDDRSDDSFKLLKTVFTSKTFFSELSRYFQGIPPSSKQILEVIATNERKTIGEQMNILKTMSQPVKNLDKVLNQLENEYQLVKKASYWSQDHTGLQTKSFSYCIPDQFFHFYFGFTQPRLRFPDQFSSQDQVDFNISSNDIQKIHYFEEECLKKWVKEILIERVDRKLPAFPDPLSQLGRLVLYDGFHNVDLVCEFFEHKVVVYGLVKRQIQPQNLDNLRTCVNNFKNQVRSQSPYDGWDEYFVLISVEDSKQKFEGKAFCFSILELLSEL